MQSVPNVGEDFGLKPKAHPAVPLAENVTLSIHIPEVTCIPNSIEIKRPKTQLAIIDAVRGLAALGVFVYHYQVGKLIAEKTGLRSLELLGVFGASYAVPIFFLISGFCIHLSFLKGVSNNQQPRFRVGKYFSRRFWRLYPAYFVAVILSICINSINGEYTTVEELLIHTFVLQAFFQDSFNSINLVLWTISVEACFYILYPIIILIRSKWGMSGALLISLVTTILSGLLTYKIAGTNLPARWLALNLWFSWVFGAWLAENYVFENLKITSSRGGKLFAAVTVLVLLLVNTFGLDSAFITILDNLKILIWAAPLCWLIKNENSVMAVKSVRGFIMSLSWVGGFSYSLYLLHLPLMYLRNVLWQGVSSVGLRGGIFVISFFLIILVARVFYGVFERPYMAYRPKA